MWFKKKKNIAPKEITKTKDYQFSIPDECLDYIEKHQGGLLFPIPQGGTVHSIFRRLVELAEVEVVANENISGHETRRLLMTIIVEKLGIDSNVADFCLEHEIQGDKVYYLDLSYETKKKAYNKYWDFIRNKIIEKVKKENNKNISNNSNFDKLKESVSMFENAYIINV